ncbi:MULTISPECIES: hypothetical protein [unclassified Pseudoalteromonas]|uniref:hypothetical protein n=1 Tax=unclassified Pseudoalteromonas TaxID=194690 RepID=UPI000C08CD33|nr:MULTISPECIES: hypothetical protein [unclassified Pseudoalteromonas]MDB2355953.1 hypothetical protein [Pseudoalteromonas sp.]MDP2636643.1 hypothetical protein [Pseudoalteromonas sp. 1_MG-2023]PHN91022.1 hypothetical protein CSC79_05165 [Pseudoalteromonas sp. 3D05]
MEAVKEKNIEVDSVNENKVKNETLTTELHFELLKQYAWLSSAVIGAIIILVQLKAVEMGNDVYITLGLLGLSIFFSIIGQDHIVDSLLKGKDIYKISKTLKLIRGVSMGCLGIGAGYFSATVF